MHPFHMLGSINASPTVHSALLGCTLQGFWVPRNLVVEKSRIETRLNGGSSSGFSWYSPNPVQTFYAQDQCSKSGTLDLASFACIGSPQGNTGNSAGNNPVPNRMAPRQLPGLYMILCLANNKRYYGESKNVSARLSQHKSRLRRNSHEIPALQHDFNLYGEDHFEFSAIWMGRDSTKEQRLALEIEHIGRFNELCYNKFDKLDRKRENNPFWKRTYSAETIEQISRSRREHNESTVPEGLAVNVKGIIYPSLSEAARRTKHSRDTLRRWLNDPTNLDCVAVNVSQPQSGSATAATQSVDPLVANTGLPKKISLYGTVYDSIADAARKRDCSRSNIQRLLRDHPNECFIVLDDQT